MRLFWSIFLSLLLGVAATAGAATVTVYSNDFDGNVMLYGGVTGGLSGVTTMESVQGLSGIGFSGKLLRNTATGNPAAKTILTLSNLPMHTSVDLNFLFAFIDSWDSINGSPAPDWFNVKIDGASVLQITAANASGNVTYGGSQLGVAHYGWSGSWVDRAFDMSPESALSLAHSNSTLTVELFAGGNGWQGGSDESWAIENLQVQVNAVPLPAVAFLLAPGLLGLVAVRKRFLK